MASPWINDMDAPWELILCQWSGKWSTTWVLHSLNITYVTQIIHFRLGFSLTKTIRFGVAPYLTHNPSHSVAGLKTRRAGALHLRLEALAADQRGRLKEALHQAASVASPKTHQLMGRWWEYDGKKKYIYNILLVRSTYWNTMGIWFYIGTNIELVHILVRLYWLF